MKRCPECRRDYYDDTLLYCLDDGNALLEGPATAPMSEPGAVATGFPASGDEPATAILHSTASPGEAPTRAQIHTTDQTAVFPGRAEAEPQGSLGGSSEKQSFSAHRAAKPLLAVLGVLAVAGIGFGIYKFAFKKDSAAPSFESMKITKLTDTGKAGSAAISPDGKYVVHVKEDAGQQSLWVRHIATGSNVQIIPPAELDYYRMTFSPDGSYIYFNRKEKSETNFALYQIPVLGGEPKKLNSNVQSPITFSPDGKRIAFVRIQQDDSFMMIANADGTGEEAIATGKTPEAFQISGPAWSPDGKVIATPAVDSNGGENIVEIRVEDGAVKQIGSQKWRDTARVAWLADGSGLVATIIELGSNASQVFQISYPGGEARKITNDLNSYHGISLTADSGSMVTVEEDRVLNIWTTPDGDTSRARQLTRGSRKWEGASGLQWTPDGKIVYYSFATGLNPIVSIMNGDGSNPRQLTQRSSVNPAVSPEGRYIVFSSPQGEKAGIWRMDIDGDNPKQLTNNGGIYPNVSPDGRWVIYTVIDSGDGTLWRVSIDGGEPVRLTDYPSGKGVVSPDGKSIAGISRESGNAAFRLAIIPFEGGQPTKLLDFPTGSNTVGRNTSGQAVRWLPDGRSLAYIVTRDGVSNIWSMPIAGGAPKQLTNFTTDQIARFDLSRDGKPTLFSRGATTKDVVLISGFKK